MIFFALPVGCLLCMQQSKCGLESIHKLVQVQLHGIYHSSINWVWNKRNHETQFIPIIFPHGNIKSRDEALRSIQYQVYILSFLISACPKPNKSIVHIKVLISGEFLINFSTNTLQILQYDNDKEVYPSMPSSSTALYCKGISIRAARAKAVSFVGPVYLFIISVKLTNYTQKRY